MLVFFANVVVGSSSKEQTAAFMLKAGRYFLGVFLNCATCKQVFYDEKKFATHQRATGHSGILSFSRKRGDFERYSPAPDDEANQRGFRGKLRKKDEFLISAEKEEAGTVAGAFDIHGKTRLKERESPCKHLKFRCPLCNAEPMSGTLLTSHLSFAHTNTSCDIHNYRYSAGEKPGVRNSFGEEVNAIAESVSAVRVREAPPAAAPSRGEEKPVPLGPLIRTSDGKSLALHIPRVVVIVDVANLALFRDAPVPPPTHLRRRLQHYMAGGALSFILVHELSIPFSNIALRVFLDLGLPLEVGMRSENSATVPRTNGVSTTSRLDGMVQGVKGVHLLSFPYVPEGGDFANASLVQAITTVRERSRREDADNRGRAAGSRSHLARSLSRRDSGDGAKESRVVSSLPSNAFVHAIGTTDGCVLGYTTPRVLMLSNDYTQTFACMTMWGKHRVDRFSVDRSRHGSEEIWTVIDRAVKDAVNIALL